MQARPPYVIFEERSIEDRNATIENGRLTMREVDYAVVRQIGSKDTVEKVAADWLDDNDRQAAVGTYPNDWAIAFRKKYQQWKEGREAPPEGFALRNWASMSKARAENYAQIGIFTVEDVAAMNEEAMQRAGMGSRADRDRAQAFLDSRATHGNTEQLAALRAEAADKDQRIKQLEETIANLSARIDGMEEVRGKRKSG
jgi:hypothetical protein